MLLVGQGDAAPAGVALTAVNLQLSADLSQSFEQSTSRVLCRNTTEGE